MNVPGLKLGTVKLWRKIHKCLWESALYTQLTVVIRDKTAQKRLSGWECLLMYCCPWREVSHQHTNGPLWSRETGDRHLNDRYKEHRKDDERREMGEVRWAGWEEWEKMREQERERERMSDTVCRGLPFCSPRDVPWPFIPYRIYIVFNLKPSSMYNMLLIYSPFCVCLNLLKCKSIEDDNKTVVFYLYRWLLVLLLLLRWTVFHYF